LRILHVNTERGWRGGEAQTLMLASGLQARGHEPLLAVAAGGELERRAREAGVPTAGQPLHGEFDLPGMGRLRRTVRSFRPDVLHAHTSHAVTLATGAGLLASPLRRIPAVLTRRVSFSLKRNPLARLKYRWRIDHLIAVADEVRWVLIREGVEPERITVIHSGIDLARFERPDLGGLGAGVRRELGVGPQDTLIGSVGALVPHKAPEILLDALIALAPGRPGLKVLFAGEGPLAPVLRKKAEAAGIADRVLLPGFRADIPAVMAALDLFVLPSRSGEGSPAVVKEAMACGVPVVASALDGVREIVEEGVEALLVQPGSAAAFADAIGSLLDDPARREEFIARGRERVASFSSHRMVERTIEVYERVARGRAPANRALP
jgi:glycosyltransferase involved in cell wall biosynthesis